MILHSAEKWTALAIALMLVAARLRHVAGSKWGLRPYVDMGRLRELDQAATNGIIETAQSTATA